MLSPGRASAASTLGSLIKTAGLPNGASRSHISKQKHRHIHTTISIASASTFPSTSRASPSTSRASHASSSKCTIARDDPIRYFSTESVRSAQRQRDFDRSASPSQDIRLTPKDSRAVSDVQIWLERAFPGLRLPDEIAMMMVTHDSWDFGVSAGHNRRLSFLGRRAMKFYLSLFLAVHDKTGSILTNERIDDLLMVWKLGDNVGRALRLEEVMRWTPAISDGQKGPRETGLFKIRGVAVEALLGAIYHQHGAQAAKAFFSSRILPSLEGFTNKEAIELEPAIVSESRAGDAMLLQMAKAQEDREREEVRGSTGTEKLTTIESSLESSETGSRHRAINEIPSSKSTIRRKSQALGSKGMPLDEVALQRGHRQDSTSLA